MADTETRQRIELTIEERETLEQIASAEPPNNQRAQAILALADGADLAEAGVRSGLTANQVRYWSGRFGTRHLSIFPEEILKDAVEEKTEEEPLLLEAPEDAPMLEAPQLAGVLPDAIPNDDNAGPSAAAVAGASAAVAATGGALAAKSKKSNDKKDKKPKKDRKGKKGKKDEKGKKGLKSKKGKKGKKSKKSKKGKKEKKSEKNKKKKK